MSGPDLQNKTYRLVQLTSRPGLPSQRRVRGSGVPFRNYRCRHPVKILTVTFNILNKYGVWVLAYLRVRSDLRYVFTHQSGETRPYWNLLYNLRDKAN